MAPKKSPQPIKKLDALFMKGADEWGAEEVDEESRRGKRRDARLQWMEVSRRGEVR